MFLFTRLMFSEMKICCCPKARIKAVPSKVSEKWEKIGDLLSEAKFFLVGFVFFFFAGNWKPKDFFPLKDRWFL